MPTVNPRVNVTLSPTLDALVSKLAKLQGVSKSQVLRELLEAAEPALQRAVALMEAASKATGDVLSGLAESLEKAQDKAEAQLSAHLAYLDAAQIDLVEQAQAVRGRRPAAGVSQRRAASPSGARFPLPPAKVQAYADRNGKAPVAVPDPLPSKRGVKTSTRAKKAVLP